MKTLSSGRRLFIRSATIAMVVFAAFISCVQDPVGDDYFLDPGRVKGGEKPSPPPVISSIVRSGEFVVIDFTTTATIDPDTGSSGNLFYLFYGATQDPESLCDPLRYYDERFYLGYVEDAKAPGKTVFVEIGDYTGNAWFWMSAHDGGRESDHSNVFAVTL